MGNRTQPWFGAARRLDERGTDSQGLVVDEAGVSLGPDFPLIRKTSRGYETVTLEELSCLREVVSLGANDTQRLTRHLESIAKALTAGDLAKARILGLYFPINRLTRDQSERLEKASALVKGNFNPDEPRDERGRWTAGVVAAPPSDATSGAQTRAGTVAGRPLAAHPGVVRVQEFLPMPIDPEFLPRPLIQGAPFPWEETLPRIEEAPQEAAPRIDEAPNATKEGPSPPFQLPKREPEPVTYDRCLDAINSRLTP